MGLLTGLLSGSYPALLLASFRPARVLKGAPKQGGGIRLRNGLVVTQFTISIVLIVGTAVIYDQLWFIRNRNPGFDQEHLLYLPVTSNQDQYLPALKSELSQKPTTDAFTVVSELPTDLLNSTISVEWEGKAPGQQVTFPNVAVDERFLEIFRIPLLAGRGFSRDFRADTANYVVNEAALKVMGTDLATAVGKPLALFGRKGKIIGVVRDFNFKPIQQTIEPLILALNTGGGVVVIRTQPGHLPATIKELARISQQLNPGFPFTFQFLREDLTKLYRSEQRMGAVFNAFAVLSILISCLGLFGLVAFTAEQRTKEIGIRKVLGASVSQIVKLLSKDFLRLVVIAFMLAAPPAWYLTNEWLREFAYRIDVGWRPFALAGGGALLVAGLTVSFQAIKAAVANPVKSLRTE